MNTNVHYLMPGKALAAGSPWLRRVDDEVVRYVREAAEDPNVALVRKRSPDLLAGVLDRKR